MQYVRSQKSDTPIRLTLEKEPLLEFLFHDAPDAIFILEPGTYAIVDCNSRAVEMFEAETRSSLIQLPSFRLYDTDPHDFSHEYSDRNSRGMGDLSRELTFRTLRQNIFWGKMTQKVFRTFDHEYVILRISKALNNKQSGESLTQLLRGTAKVTGYKFFRELTRLLCQNFGVDYAFVGKMEAGRNQMTILDASGDLPHADQHVWNLEHSVLENVKQDLTTFYADGVLELFPADVFVRRNKIRSFMGTPVIGNSGEVIGVIGYMHGKPMDEIPDSRYILSLFASRTTAEIQRVKSKQILKEQARALAHTNSVKDRLLSVISHDLINPLHTIMGFSELLRLKTGEYDKEKIVERVEIIDNSIRNIYFMLDNLNAWSAIYRDKIRPQYEEIDLPAIMQQNLDLFKFVSDTKELDVSVDISGPSLLISDAMMMDSILRNLIGNAIKYTPRKGRISVLTHSANRFLSLKVCDSGPGIPEEDLIQLNTANCDQPEINLTHKKGSGLGLILARNYLSRLGGNLKLMNNPDRGITALVELPLDIPQTDC